MIRSDHFFAFSCQIANRLIFLKNGLRLGGLYYIGPEYRLIPSLK